MGKEWDKIGSGKSYERGGTFTKPGIGERDIKWPSFSSTSKYGTTNPTCAECGGRLRGAKKCHCPQPHDHWKPMGKRRNEENEGLSGDQTGGGMKNHLEAMEAWHLQWLQEAFRVLQPGGLVKAFSGTRTFHRLAAAMEDAGFAQVRLEAWAYGSGFPKSMNVSKAFDKAAGKLAHEGKNMRDVTEGVMALRPTTDAREYVPPAPVTDEAVRWCGWGTALKPAWEPIVVGVKP